MRLFEVEFEHLHYGPNYIKRTVAVRGGAVAAIRTARALARRHDAEWRQLRPVEVRLIGESDA